MLKLIKYEYRRSLMGLLIMLGVLLALQGYFLISTYGQFTDHVLASSVLLIFALSMAVVGMLIYSVSLYSRELKSKSSYLTFMTPNSATKILGSKLLAALLLGTVLVLMFAGFFVWDYSLLESVYPEFTLGRVVVSEFLVSLTSTDAQVLINSVVLVIVGFLVNFFATVVVAYLAITVSATVLSNKRLKGLLSFVLFAAIMAGLSYVTAQIDMKALGSASTISDALVASLPSYAIYFVAMVASFFASAWLLEHKVSL